MSRDPLQQLIQSLSKAEKRQFRLYVNRLKNADESNFVRLFDVLDKMPEYNETRILSSIPGLKKIQLPNTKAHLYKQLLLSLRLSYLNQNPDIQLREQIDYARILYNKGHYRQSLRMLDKAKGQAARNGMDLLQLEIVQFEKMIELQYITGSIASRADDLTRESQRLSRAVFLQSAHNDLGLKLYDLYLKMGYVRNEADYLRLKKFFYENLLPCESLSFNERLSFYNAHVWYYNIAQDFLNSYRYALKWVNLFEEAPAMIPARVDLYLKGYHYLLGALFLARQLRRFDSLLERLEQFEGLGELSENDQLLRDQFVYQHRVNRHLLAGTFSEGIGLVPEIEAFLQSRSGQLDEHRILIFYYKIASLFFGSGDYSNTLHYLNLIIHQKDIELRGDLHCFARILQLITHFELGSDQFIEHSIKSTYRFLIKMQEMNRVQEEVFRFLRRLGDIFPQDLKREFSHLRDRLQVIAEDPFERRPFIYLDLISWLESKIEDRPVEEIIREKVKY